MRKENTRKHPRPQKRGRQQENNWKATRQNTTNNNKASCTGPYSLSKASDLHLSGFGKCIPDAFQSYTRDVQAG